MNVKIALLSTALTASALAGVPASQAASAPTAMQTVTSGTLGNVAYVVQVGEGTSDYGGGEGFCRDILIDRLDDPEPAVPDPLCDDYNFYRPKKGELRTLGVTGASSNDGSQVVISTWLSFPDVQRFKITLKGGGKEILTKSSSSTVLSLYGTKARYWFQVTDGTDELRKSVVGERKVCRKVKGKKRCSWQTVAKES